jgi:hypothetical protein
MGDYNMDVAYRWAVSLGLSTRLSAETENDYDKLVDIVMALENVCITDEFEYDRNVFRENMGRLPSQAEEPFVLQQFYTYNLERRQRLFDCITNATRPYLDMDDNERLSVGLVLWSACVATSKALDNRREYSEAQLTNVVNVLRERADAHAIHRSGQEIACLYMNRVGEGRFINFQRFPGNSAPRTYEQICREI